MVGSRKPTILVFESHPFVRKFIESNLAVRGYTLLQANSADEIVHLANAYSPALLLLDLAVLAEDEWQVLPALFAEAATTSIPILLLTSIPESDITSMQHSVPPNVHALLMKPLSIEGLLGAINEAIMHDTS
jgi:DNA-binding response OmpR family regulator